MKANFHKFSFGLRKTAPVPPNCITAAFCPSWYVSLSTLYTLQPSLNHHLEIQVIPFLKNCHYGKSSLEAMSIYGYSHWNIITTLKLVFAFNLATKIFFPVVQ